MYTLAGRTRRWLPRSLVAVLGALVLVLAGCGAGNAVTPTPAASATIGHAGTLIPGVLSWGEDSTGGMPYIVPKDSLNPGPPYYGYEVDIATHMAALMGVTEQPTQITYSDWPQGLASVKFDVFMNGLEIQPNHLAAASFSIPYYVYTESIVVLKTNTTINGFSDLPGKTVETGTAYHAQDIMDAYNAAHPSNKITEKITDTPTPFTDLLSGRVDAMFIDTPIAEWYGANDPSGKFKIVGQPSNPGYYGVAFSRSNPNTPVLMTEINAAIEALWNNGTLKHIYQDGGANNQATGGPVVFEKYGMWNDSQLCLGNFLPDHPTNVSGCPPIPPNYNK
jgi:polar amino acid transport system substrate-binding protein